MTNRIITLLALMGLVLAPAFAQAIGNGKGNGGNGGPRGGIGLDGGMNAILTGLPMEDLSNEERNGLLHMREEEILDSPMERGLVDADGKPYFGDTG